MVRARLKVLLVIFSIPPLAILLRLAWLQLVPANHRELLRQSEHRRNIFSAPVRGRILSREGSLLAGNSPVYRLRFHYPSLNPRAELLPVIEAELRKRGPFPDARAIEERLLEIANPRALASTDPSGPEWLPLIEKLDDDAAEALRRSLRKHRAIFQVRPRPGSGRHDLLVEIRSAVHMETALHRLARILASARGTDPELAYGSLRDQVALEMDRMESQVQADVKRDSDGTTEEYRLKKAQTSRRIHLENSWLLADDVPPAAVTEIEYYPDRYTGLQVEDGIRRYYPLSRAAGTITGYLGHRSPGADDSGERVLYIEHCRKLDREGFASLRENRDLRRSTDAAGIGGIEERYDSRLRGQYGLRVVSVDMIHRPRDLLEDLPPAHGEDIRTTIDAALQVTVYEALERATLPLGGPEAGTAASAAVMSLDRAERGAILASAGFPGVDPNRLTESPGAYLEELALAWKGQTTGWLYDRPSRIPLHPGSLFKIVVALGALESARSRDRDPHDPAHRYECKGEFDKVKGIGCSAEWGHGPLDLAESLGKSCNAYFFHLGLERVGPERLFDVAGRLGYGRSPGIDLSGPGASGLLASPGVLAEEKYQRDPARLRRAMCEYSIGQTFVEATPIQVLRSMAAVALRGSELPRPYLVHPQRADPFRFENSRAWETIHDGLWRAGHEAGGTAAKPELGLHRYNAAYKTGTAELVKKPEKLHQAWVAGFAPFEEPRIAFVAVVERTPLHGAEACASIVSAILERFAEEDPAAYLLEVEEKKGGVGAEAPSR